MKRTFAWMLALCLLLCGCASEPVSTTPPTTTQASTTVPTTTVPETTVPETTIPETTVPETTVPETTAPVELLYTNPLTGEPCAEPVTKRPYAVSINNAKTAMPQHGVSQADFLFEILTEGGTTRNVAIFSDPTKATNIGAVRSARTYLISIARSFDAIFAHAGGSSYADDVFAQGGIAHLNAIGGSGSYFYRNQARKDAGYAYEHTLFTTGENLVKAAQKAGFTLERDSIDYGFTFAEDGTPDGETANTVKVVFSKKFTQLTYNPEIGKYEGTQHGANYIDGETKERMTFENVIVLRAKTTYNETHTFAELTGKGTGYFACGGKYVPIKWTRASETSPFVFTLEDGTPLTLGIGNTYVGIVPTKNTVEFS